MRGFGLDGRKFERAECTRRQLLHCIDRNDLKCRSGEALFITAVH